MIELSEEATSVVASGQFTRKLRISSWLDGELLADDIPVIDAREAADRGNNVPERVVLTIPRIDDNGYNWTPVGEDHPLAANGQMLKVELAVELETGKWEWIQRHVLVIEDCEPEDDTIVVEAVGLLTKIEEARLVSPFQPKTTFQAAFRALLEPAITPVFDPALVLTDRSVVASTGNLDEDRLQAMYHLLKAWPAVARMTEDGDLYLSLPPTTYTPVLNLTDQTGGTVITASGASSRKGAYNCVVVRGTDSNNTPVQGVVYDYEGPKRVDGPFNELPVPYFFESTFVPSAKIATAVARAQLDEIKRQTANAYSVAMFPHPALQIGDVVSLTTDDYVDKICTVEALTLPYVPGTSEPMTLIVREVS